MTHAWHIGGKTVTVKELHRDVRMVGMVGMVGRVWLHLIAKRERWNF